jgi:cytochrome c oxidase subunit 2
LAQYVAPKKGLGRGFWPVTLLLTVLSIAWLVLLARTNFAGFLPEAAVPADQIDDLFKMLAEMGGVVFIYVMGFLIYLPIAWRAKKSDPVNSIGIQMHDAPAVELGFWIVPTILVVIISWVSVQIWYGLQQSPGNALTVEAIGHQFFYDFRYPTLWKPVSQELHLPLHEPVTVKVTSGDVIHGFWAPEIRLKADMVPGLVNTLRFTPTRPGTYRIVCTEFCGVAHGAMIGKIVIESQSDFKVWLAQQAKAQGPAPAVNAASGALPAAAPGGDSSHGQGAAPANGTGGGGPSMTVAGNSDAGKAVFSAHCSSCHSVGKFDEKIVGPGLGHLLNDTDHPTLVNGDKASPAAIENILHKGYTGPIGMMPNQQQNAITDTDIANVTAYLVSLSK